MVDVEPLSSKKVVMKKFYFASQMEMINGVPGMTCVIDMHDVIAASKVIFEFIFELTNPDLVWFLGINYGYSYVI